MERKVEGRRRGREGREVGRSNWERIREGGGTRVRVRG